MTTINFRSAGVSARVINLTGPTAIQPVGIPAGIIGTAQKGPAFVPTTVATTQDFVAIFGPPVNGAVNGPLASAEWLRNQQSLTFTRVLGAGNGGKREASGNNLGHVKSAGFVVGAQQPQSDGALNNNPWANSGSGGVGEGRLYFLNAYMSESNSSGLLLDAGLDPAGSTPLIRAVIMAASGVLIRLSSSVDGVDSRAPAANLVATEVNANGSMLGVINLSGGRQEFVMLLNGHMGTDSQYPRVVTASLDIDAPNYLSKQLNTDPLNIEQAGYLLYTDYPIHPQLAVPTGSAVVDTTGSFVTGSLAASREPIIFLATGSLQRNSGSTTVPSYENFEDRYREAQSPWIISQKFGGKPKNLFKIHALDDGERTNSLIKWSIENITPSSNDVQPYGTFDLLVRNFSDIDKRREVREAFRGISLDPSSPKYIARIIGDQHVFFNFDANEGSQKLVVEGDFSNVSNLIRVEVNDEVRDGGLDPNALPMGFRGPPHLVTSGSYALSALTNTITSGVLGDTVPEPSWQVVQPPVPYRESLAVGAVDNRRVDRGLNWGVQFTRKISATEPNASTELDRSPLNFAKFFPDFQTTWRNVLIRDQVDIPDVNGSVLDVDRFNNNQFSLEKIRITTDANDLPDVRTLVSWSYVRSGVSDAPGSGLRALKASDLTDSSVRQVGKFSGYIQGGFDGVRIFDEDTTNLTNQAITEEMDNTNRGISNGPTVVSYKKALRVMSDETQVDIQLLAIPGIRHPIITDEALLATEERFDAMYIMDVQEYDVSSQLLTGSSQDLSVRFTANHFQERGLNSSFGAAYFPDVVIRDEVNGNIRQVPPSVPVLGAFGLNDAIGFPWFAPAGFTRGALTSTENAVIPLNRENLDSLQEVRINPLVAFASSNGPLVWGQRTLLASDSALERVNVRRLLISLRRDVRRIANRIVFEPNRAETLARFSALVNPIFKRVQDKRGLERFLVRIDTTTTTQADIENRTIRGQIFLVPTRTLEFLSIDFTVANQGSAVTSL